MQVVGLALGTSGLVGFEGRNASVGVACMVVGSAEEVVHIVASATVAVGGMVRLEARCWVVEGTAVQVVAVFAVTVDSCEADVQNRAGGGSVCDAGLNHAACSSCRRCACC